jgi:hypothetical protein
MGLREECEQGRTLGMDGKTLIHPDQVGPCNEIFSPTEEEVSWSRKIIVAFKQPENAKKGVIVVDGRMVERLHLGMAERKSRLSSGFARWRPPALRRRLSERYRDRLRLFSRYADLNEPSRLSAFGLSALGH